VEHYKADSDEKALEDVGTLQVNDPLDKQQLFYFEPLCDTASLGHSEQ